MRNSVNSIHENSATSGVGALATYAYDTLGRRRSVTFGNGTVQSFGNYGDSGITVGITVTGAL